MDGPFVGLVVVVKLNFGKSVHQNHNRSDGARGRGCMLPSLGGSASVSESSPIWLRWAFQAASSSNKFSGIEQESGATKFELFASMRAIVSVNLMAKSKVLEFFWLVSKAILSNILD
ncbi:MAG: hypothetical protein MRY72_00990 [Aquisalinus sp.]|nr:hypothetical protein [Aquisalinus sp.]